MNGRRRHHPLVLVALAVRAAAAGACAASGATSASGDAAPHDAAPGFDGGTPGTGGRTTAGSGGFTGIGGRSAGSGGIGAGTGGVAAGGASGVGGCGVALNLVAPQTRDNLVSGPDARVRVRADVSRPGLRAPRWTWRVTFGVQDPPAEIRFTGLDDPGMPGDSSVIDFPVKDKGDYTVTAMVDTGVMCSRSQVYNVTTPGPATFVFRVTPSAGAPLGIPIQEIRKELPAVPGQEQELDVMAGNKLTFGPQSADGQVIPAYVRVSMFSSGVTSEGFTAYGRPVEAYLLPLVTYEVLIVPEGDLAPRLLRSVSGSLPPSMFNPLLMDPGTLVMGSVVTNDGAAVAGARVVLREETRPSTIGLTDTDGHFSLLTRPGTLSAVVVPPVGAPLAEAQVAGIVLDGNGATLKMIWTSFERAAFSLVVNTTDGAAPAVGARVRVESKVAREVGTMQVTGTAAATLTATGVVVSEVLTDQAGSARFPKLPLDGYQITIVPPATLADATVTTGHVTLTASGYAGTLSLARPVKLAGTLLPRESARGVRVIARDKSAGIAAPVATAIAGDQGAYTLLVAPEHLYELVAEPPPGSALTRTVLDRRKEVGPTDTVAGNYLVQTAAPFRGRVRVIGGGPLAGAVVQVFCLGLEATCPEPTLSLAEAVTSSSGTFTVKLPAAAPAAPAVPAVAPPSLPP